jgi:hypothetical protein
MENFDSGTAQPIGSGNRSIDSFRALFQAGKVVP